MSIFRKILDKLKPRKEQPTIVGTAKVMYPDPPTAASNVASTPAAKPAGPAPTSEEEVKDNRSTLDKKGRRIGRS